MAANRFFNTSQFCKTSSVGPENGAQTASRVVYPAYVWRGPQTPPPNKLFAALTISMSKIELITKRETRYLVMQFRSRSARRLQILILRHVAIAACLLGSRCDLDEGEK